MHAFNSATIAVYVVVSRRAVEAHGNESPDAVSEILWNVGRLS